MFKEITPITSIHISDDFIESIFNYLNPINSVNLIKELNDHKVYFTHDEIKILKDLIKESTIPYIEFTSKNTIQPLQCYLTSFDFDSTYVELKTLMLKSKYYTKTEDKIIFY